MTTKKYHDWRGWWDGLRSKAMQAGAESLVTNLGALFITNGMANMQIPGMTGAAMSWKTAVITTASQFGVRVIFAAAKYVAGKPDPDVITETTDTAFQSKSADGTMTLQSSSRVVTKPVDAKSGLTAPPPPDTLASQVPTKP